MTQRSPGYETSDVPPRWVGLTGLGLAVLTVLVALGAGGIVALSERQTRTAPRSSLERTHLTPPEPRLQDNPAADAAAYKGQMDHDLSTYAWIDRKNGVVRIPIAEAMRRLVAQGWPHATADTGIDPSPAPSEPKTAP